MEILGKRYFISIEMYFIQLETKYKGDLIRKILYIKTNIFKFH